MKQTGKAQGSAPLVTQGEQNDDQNQETASRESSKDQERAQLLQAFYAWLPKTLHDASFIDWKQLPSQTMAYLVKTVGDSPFAAHIALAAVSAVEPLGEYVLYDAITRLHALLRHVHTLYGVQHTAELTKALWEDYAAKVEVTSGIYERWKTYRVFTTKHLRGYIEQLTPQQHTQIEPYLLPAEDLLWFGELIRYRVLHVIPAQMSPEDEQQRMRILDSLCIPHSSGLRCPHPDILTPDSSQGHFLASALSRSSALLFEPESLYRGILMGGRTGNHCFNQWESHDGTAPDQCRPLQGPSLCREERGTRR